MLYYSYCLQSTLDTRVASVLNDVATGEQYLAAPTPGRYPPRARAISRDTVARSRGNPTARARPIMLATSCDFIQLTGRKV